MSAWSRRPTAPEGRSPILTVRTQCPNGQNATPEPRLPQLFGTPERKLRDLNNVTAEMPEASVPDVSEFVAQSKLTDQTKSPALGRAVYLGGVL